MGKNREHTENIQADEYRGTDMWKWTLAMPRYPSSGARLYLRPARSGGVKYWYVREGGRSIATGFAECDKDKAIDVLSTYAPYTKVRPVLIIDSAPKQIQPPEAVVYFVSVDQPDFPVKIGYATNMKARLSGLQNSFPFELIVLATMPGHRFAERDLHLIYCESRQRAPRHSSKLRDSPMATENEFPTIRDLRDKLTELIDRGYGALPVQIVVVPDSTIQALGRDERWPDSSKPALMIEYEREGHEIGVSFISTDRLARGGIPSLGAH